jgi:hypothetical protein
MAGNVTAHAELKLTDTRRQVLRCRSDTICEGEHRAQELEA